MPTAFSRSLRALEADSFRPSLWALALVTALLSAGCGWFFFARVAVYETSDRARLEVERAAYPVGAPASGRVVATCMALGPNVPAGDVLVEVEGGKERWELEGA